MSRPPDPALLADVGGTNVRFALADCAAAMPLRMDSVRAYPVDGFASLAEAARHYLAETGIRATHGVFSVAGPVAGDVVRMTNHPWVIGIEQTRGELGLARLLVVNDFAAQASSLRLLGERDVEPIGTPHWAPAPRAVATYAILGPGTGLGVAGLLLRDGRASVFPSEAGHVGLAPGTAEEMQVLARLQARFGRVSNERVVSGDGLLNLYRALEDGADGEGPRHPADVTAGAAAGDPRCLRAIDLFCALFGSIAGDMALALCAWDGVFLSGGVVPRLLPELRRSQFRPRFEAKGRYAATLAQVPTLAVLHPQPGLLGAAVLACDAERGGAAP